MRLFPAVVVALVLGVGAAQTVHSQSQPAPLQLGFVDVERVLGEYRKRQTVVQDYDKRKAELVQQFKQRRNQIEEKRDKLATLAEESDEFIDLQRKVDLDLLAWKRDQEYEEQRLGREQNRKIGLIYREICGEVRGQAETRGLAAVLAYDPLPAGFENRMNTVAVIQNRDVLWSDSRLDLTDEVIRSLNASLPPAPANPAPGDGK